VWVLILQLADLYIEAELQIVVELPKLEVRVQMWGPHHRGKKKEVRVPAHIGTVLNDLERVWWGTLDSCRMSAVIACQRQNQYGKSEQAMTLHG
jgi:hypothetical protein